MNFTLSDSVTLPEVDTVYAEPEKKAEEENKSFVLWILAIIGAVAAVAAIAFAVYRYMNPKYADFDGDFDYDEFEDDFEDDDIDDNDVYVKKTN